MLKQLHELELWFYQVEPFTISKLFCLISSMTLARGPALVLSAASVERTLLYIRHAKWILDVYGSWWVNASAWHPLWTKTSWLLEKAVIWGLSGSGLGFKSQHIKNLKGFLSAFVHYFFPARTLQKLQGTQNHRYMYRVQVTAFFAIFQKDSEKGSCPERTLQNSKASFDEHHSCHCQHSIFVICLWKRFV